MLAENLLLAALPPEVYEQLNEYMEEVSLPPSKILHYPGDTIKYVYFPINCLISVTITMHDGSTVEAGVIGNREMVGINAFMGGTETTQTEYIVQVSGDAVKMKAEPLRKEFNQNKQLRDVLLKYTQAFIAQISQNVACNRLHTIEKRLARWLLESSDRIQLDELDLSQEFISHMLGVRRSGVTETARHLQKKGPITYSRKKIKIVDRQGLEAISCECYETLKDEYNRLLKFNLRENR